MQIVVDEIKISERLCWDPTINGVRREHGKEHSLASLSQFQSDKLLDYLKMKLCT